MSTGFDGLDLSKLITLDASDVDVCGPEGCGPLGDESVDTAVVELPSEKRSTPEQLVQED